MSTISRLRSFLRTLVHPRRLEREMDADLRFHVAERTDDLIARGAGHEEAQRRAWEELGDPVKWKEQAREVRGMRPFDELRADIVFGLRWLRHSPVFAATAIISLGVGIGANASMFNLINQVSLQSLPVSRPDRLVVYAIADSTRTHGYYFSYRMFRALQDSSTLIDTTAVSALRMTLATGRDASDPTVTGQMVAGNYFDVLGVSAARGRLIRPSDDGPPGTSAVAVLSYGYWQRRFGGDGRVLGSVVRLNGLPFTIVGVTATEFLGTDLGQPVDVFVPLSMQPQLMAEEGRGRVSGSGVNDDWLKLIGRLKDGILTERARNEMHQVFRQTLLQVLHRDSRQEPGRDLRSLIMESGSGGFSDLRRQFSRPLLLLMAAVALVLIIACANVANLLLARAAVRRHEMALRASLGAGRSRLVRQLLTESLLIALLGGGVGLVVALWSSRALARILFVGDVYHLAARPDLRVFAFTLAVSLGTAVLFGLGPALVTSQTDTDAALRQGARQLDSGGRRFGRRDALVVLQVALSVVLLVAAGLFIRTLANLRALDLGFDREHVMTLRLEPRGSNQKSQNEPRLRQIYGLILENVERLPGVRAVSLAGATPLSNENPLTPQVTISNTTAPSRQPQQIRMMQVYPNYLQAAGIPLLAGRDLTRSDDQQEAPAVAVINHTMARRFFGRAASAVGRSFFTGQGRASFEVVGVARDVRDRALREHPEPMAYATFAKTPTGRGQMTLIVRTSVEPSRLSPAIQQAVLAVDPTMPQMRIQTLSDRVAAVSGEERLLATLSMVFGAVALTLAAVGVYGVLAYTVARRRREFGLRIALGLTPSRLRRLVLTQSCAVVGVGLLAGIAAASVLAYAISSMFFGVAPLDPLTFGAVSIVLVAVGLLSAWFPAQAAARVDPVVALRQE